MSDRILSEDQLAQASPDEIMSALFANMVLQQSNMALMFLGKMPHPESGKMFHDLEAAKMFIDQLEMIEFKTKGNLNENERHLLQQSLTTLRMAFVEAIENQEKNPPVAPASSVQPPHTPTSPSQPSAPPANKIEEPASSSDESRKRFSKKY